MAFTCDTATVTYYFCLHLLAGACLRACMIRLMKITVYLRNFRYLHYCHDSYAYRPTQTESVLMNNDTVRSLRAWLSLPSSFLHALFCHNSQLTWFAAFHHILRYILWRVLWMDTSAAMQNQ